MLREKRNHRRSIDNRVPRRHGTTCRGYRDRPCDIDYLGLAQAFQVAEVEIRKQTFGGKSGVVERQRDAKVAAQPLFEVEYVVFVREDRL